jgi:HD-like signal output (HDOD) protein
MPPLELSTDFLARLIPLDGLSDADRTELLKRSRLDSIEVGKRLPARNGERWISYLIEGSMDLIGQGSVVEHLDPELDPKRVQHPVFADNAAEQIEYATTTTPARLLSINRAAIQELISASYDVDEASLNDVEGGMLTQLYQAFHNGQMKLPSMPEVAVRVRMLADDPDSGINDIAKIIQTDPSLAARLIQAANSAAYRGSRPVDSIRDAVTRLGLKRSSSLAMSIALHGSFKTQSPSISQHMRKSWDLSVEVSALAYVIARHIRHIDPDRALLGGLLHRIGAVPILLYLESLPATEEEVDRALHRFTPMIGGLLLKEWGFDRDFIRTAEEAEHWERDDDPKPDLCDVVIAARLYANLRSPTPLPMPEITEVPAFNKLGLGALESDRTLQVLEDAAEEIASIREFLS